MKQKNVILGLVILILIGGFAYFNINKSQIENIDNINKQTNEEESKDIEVITSDIDTSAWEIYRNEELGFEVKYPEDWNHREDGSFFSPSPLIPNNDGGIYVGIISNNINIEGLDYTEAVLEVKKRGFDKFTTEHLIGLNDEDYLQLRIGQRKYTYFIDNNDLWSIGFVSGGEISLDTYNALLLTFRLFE